MSAVSDALRAVEMEPHFAFAGRRSPLPAELATTDRILQRWAVSVGTGLPTDRWLDEARSRVPPLDDDTAIVVDRIILKAPPKTRKFTVKWYRTAAPIECIETDLGVLPGNGLRGWHICLNFLRWRFSESGHGPLLDALSFRE